MQTGVTAGQSGKLRGRIGRADEFVALRLDGIIDEHNGLDQWLAAVGTGGENHVLLVDMGGVRRLNSVGVRDWVNWLRALRTKWLDRALRLPARGRHRVNFGRELRRGADHHHVPGAAFLPGLPEGEPRILDALTLKQRRQPAEVQPRAQRLVRTPPTTTRRPPRSSPPCLISSTPSAFRA
ncbi:MAG: hypothetical protein U1F43_38490 [Myxococcota bacterium]